MDLHPAVVLFIAIAVLGTGLYVARVLVVPMCRETFADARRRDIAWPMVGLVAVAGLVWLGIMAAVAAAAVRAAGALA